MSQKLDAMYKFCSSWRVSQLVEMAELQQKSRKLRRLRHEEQYVAHQSNIYRLGCVGASCHALADNDGSNCIMQQCNTRETREGNTKDLLLPFPHPGERMRKRGES